MSTSGAQEHGTHGRAGHGTAAQKGAVAQRPGPAVGTIVWGAVVMAAGALMLADRLGWLDVEPGYAAAGILLLAGVGLVVGGLLSARRTRPAAHDGDASAPGDGGPGRAPTVTD
ncbi:hypothetical protein [Sinomonas halotolerans]|uniref:DUF2530 domain-containing protein n=1 Tax=Sinomonas halotolerans TaxID=1644133 RepID=A0ABU9WY97_9MICC